VFRSEWAAGKEHGADEEHEMEGCKEPSDVTFLTEDRVPHRIADDGDDRRDHPDQGEFVTGGDTGEPPGAQRPR
jgi:hypothetical protein